ncbi:kinase-like domain-containing protein [Flagelloscypha sp. PMI_526]|nr:kinase-like domain-containing protein [Flagelloscypha sp. PMI_526]
MTSNLRRASQLFTNVHAQKKPERRALALNVDKLKGCPRTGDHKSCINAAKDIARLLQSFGSIELDSVNDILGSSIRIEWSAFGEDEKPNSMALLCREDLHVFSLDSTWILPLSSSSQLSNALKQRRGLPTPAQIEGFSRPAAASFLMLLRYNLITQDLTNHSRRVLLRLISSTALQHSILPSSFKMQGITAESLPFAGGGYADVYRGYSSSKQTLCLKVLRVFRDPQNSGPDEQAKEAVLRAFLCEALLWYQLRHRNILPFLGVSYEAFPNRICFVSPFKKNGDIMSFIKRHSPPLAIRTEWINILVDDDGMPLIADLGIATVVTSQSETLRVGTTSDQGLKCSLRWSAPEVIHPTSNEVTRSHTSTTTDIYALVSTMLEILTGLPPWSEERCDARIIYQILEGKRPTRPKNTVVPDDHWNLIERGWTQKPTDRATIRELVQRLENLSAVPRRDAFKEDKTAPWHILSQETSSPLSELTRKLVAWERAPAICTPSLPTPIPESTSSPIIAAHVDAESKTLLIKGMPSISPILSSPAIAPAADTERKVESPDNNSTYNSDLIQLSEESLHELERLNETIDKNNVESWLAETSPATPPTPTRAERHRDARAQNVRTLGVRRPQRPNDVGIDLESSGPTPYMEWLKDYVAREDRQSDVSTLSPSGTPANAGADRFQPWVRLQASRRLNGGQWIGQERSVQSSPSQDPVPPTSFRRPSRMFTVRKSREMLERDAKKRLSLRSDSTPEPPSTVASESSDQSDSDSESGLRRFPIVEED